MSDFFTGAATRGRLDGMSSTTADPTAPVDSTLAILVRQVNASDAKIPITLIVNGVSLSGHLISAHDYVKNIESDGARAIREDFSRLHQDRFHPRSEAKDSVETAEEADASAYFHLRETAVPGGASRFWRGRLAAIDAFAQPIPSKST